MTDPIVLLGPADDAHLARVYGALDARSAPVLVANSRELPAGPRLRVEAERVLIEGVAPSAVFVRALPPRHPGFVTTEKLGREARLEEEHRGGAVRDSWGAALTLLALEIPVMNPPRAGNFDQQKPLQLMEAGALGLQVPRWCICNDPEDAADFVRGVGDAIRKPVRGGDLTRAIGANRTAMLADGPQLLQERVRGADVRVTIVDGEIVSAVRLSGVSALDYRADPRYRAGETVYEPVTLDASVAAALPRLASRLSLRLAGADLKQGDDGYVFLEMNAAPMWLEIEDKTGHPITDAIVDALGGRTAP